MAWTNRLAATLGTMRYPQAWRLPLKLSRSMGEFLQMTRPVRSDAGIVVHPYCPPIGGKAFGRYLDGLRRISRGEHVPLVAHIAVTDECAYACGRCSNFNGNSIPHTGQVIDLIQQLRDAGTVCIAFTGGEPLLRQDMETLVSTCGEDIAAMLFTSGQTCDAKRAAALYQSGLKLVFVSLDDYRPEVHDQTRGRAGAFDAAVNTISAFRKARVYTAAQAVVDSELLQEDHLQRYLDFCASLEVDEVMLLEPVQVRGACSRLQEKERQRLAALHLRSAKSAEMPKINAMSLLESAKCLGCQAGFSFVYVRANGDLFPCDFAPIVIGNVFSENFGEVMARVAEHFPRPTCDCLAKQMAEEGLHGPTPISHRAVSDFVAQRSCDLPDAMRWLVTKR